MASPTNPTLLPDAECLHLIRFQASPQLITVVVATVSTGAGSSVSGLFRESTFTLTFSSGSAVDGLNSAVGAAYSPLFCQNRECPRQIFVERLPTVVAPYARRTMRLTDVFTLIGFALGGEVGKRLVAGMGLSSSPDTLMLLLVCLVLMIGVSAEAESSARSSSI